MKKSIIAIAVVSVLSLSGAYLYARGGGQGPCNGNGPGWGPGSGSMHGPGYGRGFGHLLFMKDYLGLSEEQVDKIAKIDSEYRYQYFKNRNSQNKIDALRTEHRKAVESVLTAEQKKKWDERIKDRDKRGYGYNCPWAK